MGSSKADIAAQLRDEITSGKYKPGEKLPGYRAIAEMYGAVPNTAGAAVRQLASEGLVALKEKSPAVVRSRETDVRTPEARLTDARDELMAVQDEVRDVRRHLGELEQRVSVALSKLED